MQRTLLSALTVMVASAAHWPVSASALAPIAFAAEPTRFNLQETRLEALDSRTNTTVHHKIQVEYLNNQTKAIADIQATRLNALDARTKTIVR